MSELKRGKFSEEEKQKMFEWAPLFTEVEIATKLNRDVNAVIGWLQGQKLVEETKQRKITVEETRKREELQKQPFWDSIKRQFTKREIETFISYYMELMSQFNWDTTFTEQLEIVDLIRTSLLCDKLLYEKANAEKNVRKLEDELDEFYEENGKKKKYSTPDLMQSHEMLKMEIKSCQMAAKSYSSEYKVLLEKKQSYHESLKATRKQRSDEISQSKTKWADIIKLVQSEGGRMEESRKLTLMNMAADKEFDRLSQVHRFSNGELDQCILTPENIIKEMEKE